MKRPFIFALILLLSCCRPVLKERIVWQHEIGNVREEISLPVNAKIPEDVGFLLVTQHGYESWGEVLNTYTGLQIRVETIESDKTTGKYLLSPSLSENCRLIQYPRANGRFDIGWRFVNKTGYLNFLKIHIIDESGVLTPSTQIRLLSLC